MRVPEDDARGTSAIAPGAITALLRDVFRLPPVDGKDALPELRPGQAVGRFELVREIGRGGFGVVYEAADRQLRRAVAVKAVRMGGDVDVELKEERLLREAEAAAQLSHPNIVTLFDVGSVERGPYLVMELLRGRTLGDRLRQGALPVDEALRIGVDVARAVAHAHAHGVVHRDLTARNVFLCDDAHVKVLDFGMAQAFGHRKLDGGTVAYMAPEQYRRAPEDERTDVFALGVILHEMLAGSVPFPDVPALDGPAEAPVLRIPGRPALGPLIARMLAKDPSRRPRDGQEVLTALQACLEATPSGPAPLPVDGRSRAARRLLLVAPAVLLVAAAALLLARPRTPSAPALAAAPEAVLAPPATAGAGLPAPPAPVDVAPAVVEVKPATTERRADAPPAGAVPPRPASTVRFCRGSIDAVPTPDAGTGDGVLAVDADPYAEVSVNGRRYGETPRECQVSAGAYTVRVAHPQHGSRERRVLVRRGERTQWVADLLGGH